MLASQHGGKGTVPPSLSGLISCLEIILVTLWRATTVFELSVAGISAKLWEWMEAEKSNRLERTPNMWDVAEPLFPFL